MTPLFVTVTNLDLPRTPTNAQPLPNLPCAISPKYLHNQSTSEPFFELVWIPDNKYLTSSKDIGMITLARTIWHDATHLYRLCQLYLINVGSLWIYILRHLHRKQQFFDHALEILHPDAPTTLSALTECHYVQI